MGRVFSTADSERYPLFTFSSHAPVTNTGGVTEYPSIVTEAFNLLGSGVTTGEKLVSGDTRGEGTDDSQ